MHCIIISLSLSHMMSGRALVALVGSAELGDRSNFDCRSTQHPSVSAEKSMTTVKNTREQVHAVSLRQQSASSSSSFARCLSVWLIEFTGSSHFVRRPLGYTHRAELVKWLCDAVAYWWVTKALIWITD